VSFSSLCAYLRQAGVRGIVVGLSSDTVPAFNIVAEAEGAPEFFAALGQALEVCEEQILAEHPQPERTARNLLSWLTDALGNGDTARKFISYLKLAAPFDGDCLCRQGDPSDELLIVERGRVSVTVARPGQSPLHVRVFGPHTFVGEIGSPTG
jgi:hypothetical protein